MEDNHHNKRTSKRTTNNRFLGIGSTIATTAIVAYGTYQIGKWLWNQYNTNDNEKEDVDSRNTNIRIQSEIANGHHVVDNYVDRESNDDTIINERNQLKILSSNPFHNNKFSNSNDHHQILLFQQQQRRYRYERCKYDTIHIMKTFLPIIHSTIISFTDMTKETTSLKRIRKLRKKHKQKQQQQQEQEQEKEQQYNNIIEEQLCWNTIQIMSFTRFCATIHIYVLFYVTIIIQSHIIGDHIIQYEQQQTQHNNNNNNHKLSFQHVLHYALNNILLERTIPKIINLIRQGTDEIFSNQQQDDNDNCWNVLSHHSMNITVEQFDNKINEIIHKSFNNNQKEITSTTQTKEQEEHLDKEEESQQSLVFDKILKLLLESSHEQQQEQDIVMNSNKSVQQLKSSSGDDNDETSHMNNNSTSNIIQNDHMALYCFHETLDLLESPITRDTYVECIDTIFHVMIQQKCFYDTNNNHIDTNTKPLASIITQLKQFTEIILIDDNDNNDLGSNNYFMKRFESFPSVRELRYTSFYSS